MKLCPVCKTECEDGALYCSNCGCALPPTPVEPFVPSFEAPAAPEPSESKEPAASMTDGAVNPQQETPYAHAPQNPAYTGQSYTGAPQGMAGQAPNYTAPQNFYQNAPRGAAPYGQPYPYQNASQNGAPYGQQSNVYQNVPQGAYSQPPYPNPSQKSKKGLVIGLVCGGVALLVIVAVIVCAVLFSGMLDSVEKESSLNLESSDRSEISFEEEPEQSIALPDDPHDLNLAVSNPFITEENGNVTFTVPALFFEAGGQDVEEIRSLIQSLGSANIQASADGGLQITMSKTAYNLFLSSFDAGLKIGFDEMEKDGTFTSVIDIEPDGTYSVIKVTIDRTAEDAELDEYTANLTVSAIGGLRQMLSGVPAEMTMVTVQFVDAATGEIYNEQENVNPAQYLADLM